MESKNAADTKSILITNLHSGSWVVELKFLCGKYTVVEISITNGERPKFRDDVMNVYESTEMFGSVHL